MKETVMPGVDCWFRAQPNPLDPNQVDYVLLVFHPTERTIWAYEMEETDAVRLYFDVGHKLCENVAPARLMKLCDEYWDERKALKPETVFDTRPPRQKPQEGASRGLWGRFKGRWER